MTRKELLKSLKTGTDNSDTIIAVVIDKEGTVHIAQCGNFETLSIGVATGGIQHACDIYLNECLTALKNDDREEYEKYKKSIERYQAGDSLKRFYESIEKE